MGKTNDYKVIRDSSRNCLHVCGLLQLLCACIDVKIHQKTDSGTCVLVFNTKGSLASFHCTQIIAVPKGIERTCMRNFYCTFHTNQNRIWKLGDLRKFKIRICYCCCSYNHSTETIPRFKKIPLRGVCVSVCVCVWGGGGTI